MSRNTIITGIKVSEQMKRAQDILEKEIIPSYYCYTQKRKELDSKKNEYPKKMSFAKC